MGFTFTFLTPDKKAMFTCKLSEEVQFYNDYNNAICGQFSFVLVLCTFPNLEYKLVTHCH